MIMTSNITLRAADHLIKSVTVFKSSKAEIVRTFRVDLEQGQNKVHIQGLPSTLDTHSVRVSGLGDARLFDTVSTVKSEDAETYAPDSSSDVIRALKVKILALEAEKSVREQESQLLVKYAQTLTGEHFTPVEMGQFLDKYLERERNNHEAISILKEKILQLERQIAAETEKTASKRGTARGQVEVVIVADNSTSVDLKLTYIVSNAKWTPTYELHATTENGRPSSSVRLHYRARVTQSTGEDWDNTTLTLSTVTSDTVVRQIPRLRTVKLHQSHGVSKGFQKNALFAANKNNIPFPQQQQQQQQQFATAFGANTTSGFGNPQASQPVGFFGAPQATNVIGATRTAPPPSSLFGRAGTTLASARVLTDDSINVSDPELELFDYEEVEGTSASTEPTTIVSETPMAISFSVHGKSTIPSDGIDHQVSVAVLPFTAKISYIVIPRMDPRVFLQCEVENTSEYRLLPGPVTVILDDSYVSKTSINDINTGDNFECTLGDDASTKVTYERSSKTVKSSGGAFSEVTNTTTYTSKIAIHNKHQFAITDLIVRDVVPICDDKRVQIVLRKPAGLADAKDGQSVDLNNGLRVAWERVVDGKGGEKEGKFEWRWRVGNGSKINLEAEWEVKAPGDACWVETF